MSYIRQAKHKHKEEIREGGRLQAGECPQKVVSVCSARGCFHKANTCTVPHTQQAQAGMDGAGSRQAEGPATHMPCTNICHTSHASAQAGRKQQVAQPQGHSHNGSWLEAKATKAGRHVNAASPFLSLLPPSSSTKSRSCSDPLSQIQGSRQRRNAVGRKHSNTKAGRMGRSNAGEGHVFRIARRQQR